MANNLPNIKVDSVLAQLGLEEGSQVPTPEVIKALWNHIKQNDLKVPKV